MLSGEFWDQNFWQERQQYFHAYAQDYCRSFSSLPIDEKLKKSMEYSLLGGGKRFRPLLSLIFAETFGVSPKEVAPWALAVEMIHTYSLIHDDLPCMDNDDFRRGEPTNHKVFGESTALLSGDALLTESFLVLTKNYRSELSAKLVYLLSEAAGMRGMIGGQSIDMLSKIKKLSRDEILFMHQTKTGALIRVAVAGSAEICGLPEEKKKFATEFGEHLGLAFQMKDDLLDSQESIEVGSLVEIIGQNETEKLLAETSQRAKSGLLNLDVTTGPLMGLIEMNLNRSQ